MDDRAADAEAKHHATARQAATIAKKGNVRQLVLGHFSARYKDLEPLLLEAKEVFPETILAYDGQIIEL
jgi:ribonuclease Z